MTDNTKQTTGTMKQTTGTMKWVSDGKSYGFIETSPGREVLVDISAQPASGGHRTLTEGQRVQFDIVQDRGRDRATNVVLL
jgi:cold shock protein